jgi:metal-responsive CopG/Arc/MetJ family transcriptional regulator
MAEEKKQQVNVEMTTSLVEFIDELADEDQSTRSAVVRKLIMQERARRQQLPLPTPQTEKKSTAERREPVAA